MRMIMAVVLHFNFCIKVLVICQLSLLAVIFLSPGQAHSTPTLHEKGELSCQSEMSIIPHHELLRISYLLFYKAKWKYIFKQPWKVSVGISDISCSYYVRFSPPEGTPEYYVHHSGANINFNSKGDVVCAFSGPAGGEVDCYRVEDIISPLSYQITRISNDEMLDSFYSQETNKRIDRLLEKMFGE